MKDERHAEAFLSSMSLAEEDALPLGERARRRDSRRAESDDVKQGPGGSREITFFSTKKNRSRPNKREEEEEDPNRKRRSVQSLGLKSLPGRGRRGRRR